MNLQRMKFAWVRGARIQRQDFNGVWNDLLPSTCPLYEMADRIHPNDRHLQYGVLSSALRETVISGQTHPAFHGATGVLVSMFPKLQKEWWDLDGDDRRMQFLFLAELLADEGL